MNSQDLRKFPLPDSPGVYFFRKEGKILYIGKASSLKDRVKSYFVKDILMTRSPLIAKMLEEAEKIEYVQTDSVLEALILEANEIKKHQPFFNSREKDGKSYNFVTITTEEFPRVIVTRGSGTYGPFPHASELKEALKIIRKIFPYRDDKCKLGKARPCFNAQIGLCSGPCAGWVSKANYQRTIRHIKLFFEAKKLRLVKSLEKDMKLLSRGQKFEEAEKIKRQIFALDHIQDIALLKNDVERRPTKNTFRIEAYDIAHLSGKDVVGVMTVVEDGELAKSQYRKFSARGGSAFGGKTVLGNSKPDDTAALAEVLSRRLNHPEWRFPNLVVVDGGKGQINAAKEVLKSRGLKVPVVSVVKDERHKAREIIGGNGYEREVLLANAEAHRFAIGYHRKLFRKGFRL